MMTIFGKIFGKDSSLDGEQIDLHVISDLPIGILIVDEQMQIASANDRALKLFGYRSGEPPIGMKLTELLPGVSSGSKSDGRGPDTMTTKQDSQGCKKSGEKFPVKVWLRPVLIGNRKRLLVSVADLTQEREIERLKQQFVAMVSHDLRTPLTSVQATLSLFRTGMYGEISEEGVKRLDVTEEVLERLMNLVNELLDLERMGSGQFDLNYTQTDIQRVVERALASVEGAAKARDIKIAYIPLSQTMFADEDRLVQVLVNFLSNAIKFSPEGEVVRIATTDLGKEIQVDVTDKGRGVPPIAQQAIFEKFKQVQVRDATTFGGTGLGLAIAKSIVESHGGHIGVTSEEGKGSTFWFRIKK